MRTVTQARRFTKVLTLSSHTGHTDHIFMLTSFYWLNLKKKKLFLHQNLILVIFVMSMKLSLKRYQTRSRLLSYYFKYVFEPCTCRPTFVSQFKEVAAAAVDCLVSIVCRSEKLNLEMINLSSN